MVPQKLSFYSKKMHFLEADSAAGANALTGTAFDAGLRINRIVFALGDCTYRALINTCTACYAVC